GININLEEIKTNSIGETLKKVKVEESEIIYDDKNDINSIKRENIKSPAVDSINHTNISKNVIPPEGPVKNVVKPNEGDKLTPPLPDKNNDTTFEANNSPQPEHGKITDITENRNTTVNNNEDSPVTTPDRKKVEIKPADKNAASSDKPVISVSTPIDPKKNSIGPQPTPAPIKQNPVPIISTPVETKRPVANPPPTPIAVKSEPIPPPVPVATKSAPIPSSAPVGTPP
ncbi:MAG: hypothetical protein Q8942_06665, partial [Bacillota bacterium]|nr:hypothetical protein [Bacillota bacterium]